jgi:HEAT repeat protein
MFTETEQARLLARRAAEEAESERAATEARQRADRNVKLASPAAITQLVEMLGDPDPAVRFKAAQEIAKLASVGKGEDGES